MVELRGGRTAAGSWGSSPINSGWEEAVNHEQQALQRPHGEQVPSSVHKGGDRKAKVIFCLGVQTALGRSTQGAVVPLPRAARHPSLPKSTLLSHEGRRHPQTHQH